MQARFLPESVEALAWLRSPEGAFWIEMAGIDEKMVVEGTQELADRAKTQLSADPEFCEQCRSRVRQRDPAPGSLTTI